MLQRNRPHVLFVFGSSRFLTSNSNVFGNVVEVSRVGGVFRAPHEFYLRGHPIVRFRSEVMPEVGKLGWSFFLQPGVLSAMLTGWLI